MSKIENLKKMGREVLEVVRAGACYFVVTDIPTHLEGLYLERFTKHEASKTGLLEFRSTYDRATRSLGLTGVAA